MNTIVATLVRSAVGTIYNLVLAMTALAIKADIMIMTAAANAASAIHLLAAAVILMSTLMAKAVVARTRA